MQRRLLDILADPDDPDQWPLQLKIFKEEKRERQNLPHPHENGLLCKFYCYLKDQYLVENPLGDEEKQLSKEKLDEIVKIEECFECIKTEVIDGILYHHGFEKLKWFIIDREIPVMFPEDLRDVPQERKFIKKYEKECNELGVQMPELKSREKA